MTVVLLVGAGAVFVVLLSMIDGGLLKSQAVAPGVAKTLTYSCEAADVVGLPEFTLDDVTLESIDGGVSMSGICNLRVDCSMTTIPDKTCEDLTPAGELPAGQNYQCGEVEYSVPYLGGPVRPSGSPGTEPQQRETVYEIGPTLAELTDEDKIELTRRLRSVCANKFYIPGPDEDYYGEVCENNITAEAQAGLDRQKNLTIECTVFGSPPPQVTQSSAPPIQTTSVTPVTSSVPIQSY